VTVTDTELLSSNGQRMRSRTRERRSTGAGKHIDFWEAVRRPSGSFLTSERLVCPHFGSFLTSLGSRGLQGACFVGLMAALVEGIRSLWVPTSLLRAATANTLLVMVMRITCKRLN
jgi:hypothetical protein